MKTATSIKCTHIYLLEPPFHGYRYIISHTTSKHGTILSGTTGHFYRMPQTLEELQDKGYILQ